MAFGSFNPAKPDQIASQIVNGAIAAGFTPPNIGSDTDKALLVLANTIPAFPLRLAFGGGVMDTIYANFTSLSSPTGATPQLMQNSFAATTFMGASNVGLSAGLMIAGWGTFANNASAKTVVLNVGGGVVATITATVSTANSWFSLGFSGFTSNTAQTSVALGFQGPGTPTFVVVNPAATAINLTTTAFVVSYTGTQTTAADIIQNGMWVGAL
jgi:hypothetical protein